MDWPLKVKIIRKGTSWDRNALHKLLCVARTKRIVWTHTLGWAFFFLVSAFFIYKIVEEISIKFAIETLTKNRWRNLIFVAFLPSKTNSKPVYRFSRNRLMKTTSSQINLRHLLSYRCFIFYGDDSTNYKLTVNKINRVVENLTVVQLVKAFHSGFRSEIRYCAWCIQPVVHILSQLHPFHTYILFLMLVLNILSSTPISVKYSFYLIFSYENMHAFQVFPCVLCVSSAHIL